MFVVTPSITGQGVIPRRYQLMLFHTTLTVIITAWHATLFGYGGGFIMVWARWSGLIRLYTINIS